MHGRTITMAAVATVAAASSGCGVHFFDGFRGQPVVEHRLGAPAEEVWSDLAGRLDSLGLLVSEIRTEDQTVQLGWITAPGDGAEFLSCRGGGPVGSASLHPRIQVQRLDGGSRLVIASEARATTGTGCVSTGSYERMLARRLGLVAGARVATAPDSDGGGLEER